MVCKLYCEHSALRTELSQWTGAGRLELVYFPYDPDSKTSKISAEAMPSDAQWRDLESMTWNDLKTLGATWDDYRGSEHLPQIRSILGSEHRRDALHVDSAYKCGC